MEAEFYSYAVYGHGLNDTLLGGGPGSVGGQQATFLLESTRQYATEIANDEINHVADLRALLGAAAGADHGQLAFSVVYLDLGKCLKTTIDVLAGIEQAQCMENCQTSVPSTAARRHSLCRQS